MIDSAERRLRSLHDILDCPATAVLADGELLDSFLERRDEAAFAALVHRHGAMVWGVCRRVLESAHDAEDAFQATFLVLATKGHSIRPRDAVGNWLYGVAYRTACKARSLRRRLRQREALDLESLQYAVAPPATDDESHAILHQELSQLPSKYREPIVLCHLEGRRRADVAEQLGINPGTLSSRLARGRTQLQQRLLRRGLAPTPDLDDAPSSSAIPPALLEATVGLAHSTDVPTRIWVLGQSASTWLLVQKVKRWLVVALVLTLVGLGASITAKLATRAKPKPSHSVAFRPLVVGEEDPVPAKEVHRLPVADVPHHVTFDSTGKHLLAVVGDKVHLWDAKSAKPVRQYASPLPWMKSLALSPAGDLVVGYDKKTAVVWKFLTGEVVRRLPHEDELFSARFSPDAKSVLTGTGTFTNVPDGAYINCFVLEWDVATGRLRRRFEGMRRPPRALAYSPEGHVLGFATYQFLRWHANSGKILARHRCRGLGFEYPYFAPDGRSYLVPTEKSVAVWNCRQGLKTRQLRDLPVHVRWMAFGRGGRWLLTGCSSNDTTARLWDLLTGRLLATCDGHTGHLQGVALSPDDRRIATCSNDKTVRIYSIPIEVRRGR